MTDIHGIHTWLHAFMLYKTYIHTQRYMTCSWSYVPKYPSVLYTEIIHYSISLLRQIYHWILLPIVSGVQICSLGHIAWYSMAPSKQCGLVQMSLMCWKLHLGVKYGTSHPGTSEKGFTMCLYDVHQRMYPLEVVLPEVPLQLSFFFEAWGTKVGYQAIVVPGSWPLNQRYTS